MAITKTDRNQLAEHYALSHLETDAGIQEIYYLPKNSGEREIRFIEVNTMIGFGADSLEPISFGIDRETENEHQLLVLDVTPEEWEQIQQGRIKLPLNWSLEGKKRFPDE